MFSIVLPVYNEKPAFLKRAYDSVASQNYENWELHIIDDGSTAAETCTYLHELQRRAERRITFTTIKHGGSSRARNAGLERCTGDVVAYLDSDNEWTPGYLSRLALEYKNKSTMAIYTVREKYHKTKKIGTEFVPTFDLARLYQGNYVDLNVYSHKRALYEAHGGFDETLTRFVDWDLVMKFSLHCEPTPVEMVGAKYYEDRRIRISTSNSSLYNKYRVQKKYARAFSESSGQQGARSSAADVSHPTKVLYVLRNFDQLSETYVTWELKHCQNQGVDIEIWVNTEPTTPVETGTVKIHRGSLSDAIAKVVPDMIHVHWTNVMSEQMNVLKQCGVPVTGKIHRFESSAAVVKRLANVSTIAKIYGPPHLIALCNEESNTAKLQPFRVPINPEIHFPPLDVVRKDRRMVIRAGACLPTKNLEMFIELAAEMKGAFKFVLCVVVSRITDARRSNLLDSLQRLNVRLGNPVDLRVNVSREDVARLMQTAGIYLHTISTSPRSPPYGQPISIAEAMACGCHVIAQDSPRFPSAVRHHIGSKNQLYNTTKDAVDCLQRTTSWSDLEWIQASLYSTDRAYRLHVPDVSVEPLLSFWENPAAFFALQRRVAENQKKNSAQKDALLLEMSHASHATDKKDENQSADNEVRRMFDLMSRVRQKCADVARES